METLKFRFRKVKDGWLLMPIHKDGVLWQTPYSSRTKAMNKFLRQLYSWLEGATEFTIIAEKKD